MDSNHNWDANGRDEHDVSDRKEVKARRVTVFKMNDNAM